MIQTAIIILLYILGAFLMCAHLASRGTKNPLAFLVMGLFWFAIVLVLSIVGPFVKEKQVQNAKTKPRHKNSR